MNTEEIKALIEKLKPFIKAGSYALLIVQYGLAMAETNPVRKNQMFSHLNMKLTRMRQEQMRTGKLF